MKWQTNDNLRRKHFLFSCKRVMWITSSVQQYTWLFTSPWRWLAWIKYWRMARQGPILLLLNSFSGWCCSLLIRLMSPASFYQSKPFSQIQTVTVLSLASGASSSASRALCFQISKRLSSVSAWSCEFGSSKTSSSSSSYVRICAFGFNISGLWENELQNNANQGITVHLFPS